VPDTVSDRFLDAGEEPKQTLIPIEGYEKKPLVLLKEAVISSYFRAMSSNKTQ